MPAHIRHHIRSNVVGYLALFFSLSGGVAWATHPGGADTISSGDIINNDVRTADIRDANLTTADIRAGAVTQGKLGDDANAPRAYAFVNGDATLDPARSTAGISVSRNSFGNPGSYCFDLNFTPRSVSATPEGFTSPDVFIVQAHVGTTFSCPGAEAMAVTHAAPGFGTKDEPFYIQFYD